MRLAAVQSRPGKLLPILFLTGLTGLVAIGIREEVYVINGRLTQTIGYSLFALLCAALVAMAVEIIRSHTDSADCWNRLP